MKQFWLRLLNILFPVTCVECGGVLPYDDTYRVCESCLGKLKRIGGLYCVKCGTDLPDGGEHCFNCRGKTSYHFESIRAACVYEGVGKDLVHKLKYGGREFLDRIIGRLMGDALAVLKFKDEIDCVVFVPMHWIKEYLRGYNQAELIARKISDLTGKPLLKALARNRNTRAQYKLKKDARLKNVTGSFSVRDAVKENIRDKTILLIDDVCTTCSTVEECARVLRQAGAAKVYGMAFARD